MYILAPLALALLFSGALYKTNTIWNKDVYDIQMSLLREIERRPRQTIAGGRRNGTDTPSARTIHIGSREGRCNLTTSATLG